ncbi:MAG: hypothetical protein JWQ96_2166 [Segetibacter sp.]|nr:hypothetical protein [Segetibacter sp.]
MAQNFTKLSLFIILILGSSKSAFSQVIVSGTVYDITKKTPIEAVSVISTSGKGTFTDSLGRYSLDVSPKDSIYFSFLNKPTAKYAVTNIPNLDAFDISILKKVQELPGVLVKQRSYKFDSLQNRDDYAKIFNYRKPGVSSSMNNSPGGLSVGIDLDEVINMFKFRRNKSTLAFQNRLLREEMDKYVSHRFNKGLVKKLTGLNTPEIDSFMLHFRPPYEFVRELNDLEFGQYVMEAYKYFKGGVEIDRKLMRWSD